MNDTVNSIICNGILEPHHIASQLRLYLETVRDPVEREKVQTEIDCFEFSIRHGKLVPLLENRSAEGEILFARPDLRTFDPQKWKYIEDRLNSKPHPFLKARYAHLLWIGTKHNQFAKQAVIAYKELSELYFQEAVKVDKHYYLFCKALECYHHISISVKFELEDCKNTLLSWLKTEDLPLVWRGNILKHVTESPLFKSQDLSGLTEYIVSKMEGVQMGYRERQCVLEPLLPLAKKEGVALEPVYRLLGENELLLAEQRQNDDTGIIPFVCYQRAAEYFKLANDLEQYNVAMKLYADQKKKVKLSVISTEHSGEEVQRYNSWLNQVVDFALDEDPNKAFLFLTVNKKLLLPKEKTDDEIKKEKKNSVTDLFTLNLFDQNVNGKELDENEKIAFHRQQAYSLDFQVRTLVIMEKLFYKGIRTGFITQDSFLGYFQQSWFGQSLQEISTDQEPIFYSWMELIGPGLLALYNVLEKECADLEYKPNWVLAIDSLTIKFEGALRDFVLLAGIPVSTVKKGEYQEMLLDGLLFAKNITPLFEPEDLQLWQFVFTQKGWNVRNNVAHGFLKPSDYTKQKMWAVLLALYRLSGYKIKNSQM